MDRHTGQTAWKTARSGEMHNSPQLKKAYGTPLIVTIGERPLLLSPASDWLYSHDPVTGAKLWKQAYGDLGFSIVADQCLAMASSIWQHASANRK